MPAKKRKVTNQSNSEKVFTMTAVLQTKKKGMFYHQLLNSNIKPSLLRNYRNNLVEQKKTTVSNENLSKLKSDYNSIIAEYEKNYMIQLNKAKKANKAVTAAKAKANKAEKAAKAKANKAEKAVKAKANKAEKAAKAKSNKAEKAAKAKANKAAKAKANKAAKSKLCKELKNMKI